MSKPELTDFTPNTLKASLNNYYPVVYCGVVTYVPKGYKWIAMDKDGTINVFDNKPIRLAEFWGAPPNGDVLPEINDVSYLFEQEWIEQNWFNSLIKIKKLKKLTGASLHEVIGVEA